MASSGHGTAVTLATLREDVRYQVDIDSTSNAATNVQIDRLIQLSLRSLAGILEQAGDTNLVVVGETFSATQGAFAYNLNTVLTGGAQSILYVDWADSNNEWHRMRRTDWKNRTTDLTEASWSAHSLPEYYVDGGSLYFTYPPNSTETIAITYNGFFPEWTLGSSAAFTFYMQPGWEEFIKWNAVLSVRDRMNEDPRIARAERNKAEEIVREGAGDRNKELKTVRDEYQSNYGTQELRDIVTLYNRGS